MEVTDRPSVNQGPRREGAHPGLVVIHHTAMRGAEDAIARLCDPASEVSAHYVIGARGGICRLVPESARAWHAGAGRWGGVRDVNSHSIGIELANPGPLDGFPPFPEPQMLALEWLLDGVMARWNIPPARVIAHSDMAPGRKFDPGPKFDWQRLALAGRAVWPEDLAPAVADWPVFREATLAIGYRAPEGTWRPVLDAFRLRFRPMAQGTLMPGDVAAAMALAARHPCVDPAGVRA